MLDDDADLYGRAERALFAAMRCGLAPCALKSEFMERFGLTARQFNALAINLKGKIASIKERRDGLIAEAKARIKKAQQVVAKLDKALAKPIEAVERQRLLNKRVLPSLRQIATPAPCGCASAVASAFARSSIWSRTATTPLRTGARTGNALGPVSSS
ncbi:hypothetical protein [Thiocystis violascens]|uniref:hypothetical protein n=1 Tax=Thiocystis violascens TaxID=73141 RepID=UPI00022C0432|nr:hypothetical protein [Thiocystis violascens]